MTKNRNFKATVRARMEQTGEKYTIARQAILDQRAKLAAQQPEVPRHRDTSDAEGEDEEEEGDGEGALADPTSIVSTGLEGALRDVWPNSAIDIVKGGLRAASEPYSPVFRSHLVLVRVPRQHGTTRVEVEVRTGERRANTSEFRVWAWIDGEEDDWLDQRVDLLSDDALKKFLSVAVVCVMSKVPNTRPIVPGQQLRNAIEWSTSRLAGFAGGVLLLQAPSLRPQDTRVPASGRVRMAQTVPVEVTAAGAQRRWRPDARMVLRGSALRRRERSPVGTANPRWDRPLPASRTRTAVRSGRDDRALAEQCREGPRVLPRQVDRNGAPLRQASSRFGEVRRRDLPPRARLGRFGERTSPRWSRMVSARGRRSAPPASRSTPRHPAGWVRAPRRYGALRRTAALRDRRLRLRPRPRPEVSEGGPGSESPEPPRQRGRCARRTSPRQSLRGGPGSDPPQGPLTPAAAPLALAAARLYLLGR